MRCNVRYATICTVLRHPIHRLSVALMKGYADPFMCVCYRPLQGRGARGLVAHQQCADPDSTDPDTRGAAGDMAP